MITKPIHLALDAMGGDHGPVVVIPSALVSLEQFPELKITLVGDKNILDRYFDGVPVDLKDRLFIHHASQVVGMSDKPVDALRKKRDSSMHVGLGLLKDKVVNSFVSSGNTGALMAIAKYVLKTINGISRPAIVRALPTIKNRSVYVLDLGANVDCDAHQLVEFAIMGDVLAKSSLKGKTPKLGLLNVGSEAIKGSAVVKQCHELLTQLNLPSYIGYVEGNQIFEGNVDVVICDGFVGNTVLKSIEGLAKMLLSFTKNAFNQNMYAKLAGLISKPVLTNLAKVIDPRKYNGASLIGLNGVVIKSHGSADVESFTNAIKIAYFEALDDIPSKIQDEISKQISALN